MIKGNSLTTKTHTKNVSSIILTRINGKKRTERNKIIHTKNIFISNHETNSVNREETIRKKTKRDINPFETNIKKKEIIGISNNFMHSLTRTQ